MAPDQTTGEEKRWSVFVGGGEVNDYLMDFNEATALGQEYVNDGYDDVSVYQYDTGEELRLW